MQQFVRGWSEHESLEGFRIAIFALAMAIALLCAVRPGWAESIELDADRTRIAFNLDSTLHRIEGNARLSSGNLEFSPEGGAIAGRIVIDARSLETGNGLRDSAMHKKVLESERFSTIELRLETLEVGAPANGIYPIVLGGELDIHGGKHALQITARVSIEGDEAHIRGSFEIPHVAWGMRDMSNLLLNVDEQVTVEIDAVGRILRDGTANSSEPPGTHAAPHAAPHPTSDSKG